MVTVAEFAWKETLKPCSSRDRMETRLWAKDVARRVPGRLIFMRLPLCLMPTRKTVPFLQETSMVRFAVFTGMISLFGDVAKNAELTE